MTGKVAIIGAGPAGLFAAESLAARGHRVVVFERMASPARKFLFAGRGGLNLTHSEPLEPFLARYGAARDWLATALAAFPPEALQAWAESLGEATFTGTSGRVFPKSFKATPLLRAWLKRLEALGVTFHMHHRWTGWQDGALTFDTPDGPIFERADATLLALGGASWPRLGADGGWVSLLQAAGVVVETLHPSNVGVRVAWSEPFATRHEGAPLKGLAFAIGGQMTRAEAVVTRTGLEGGAIYALSAPIRAALAAGVARLSIDLKPDMTTEALVRKFGSAKKGDSLSNVLRKQGGLSPVAVSLLREATGNNIPRDPVHLAAAVKAVTLEIAGLHAFDRAISTAGGIAREELDAQFMLKRLPGVFVAGEMLDWDAPTGGYLLQACFSTAHAAAEGMLAHLARS